jgi:hypothetical protein
VIFAYGQTGSGKTHTMNGIMDELCESDIFKEGSEVEFTYLEMLGANIKDCLNTDPQPKPVAIGEALDGRILTRNVSIHPCADSSALKALVSKAKSLRSVAATEKNAASSRAHGIGIISCTDVETGVTGKLYVIDLAGSESAKDR